MDAVTSEGRPVDAETLASRLRFSPDSLTSSLLK